MAKIDTLIDQTVFLLDKQRDVQRDCDTIFKDLLAVIQIKLAQASKQAPEEVEQLEKVIDLIAEQAEKISEEAQVDIDFLAEQLEALEKIKSVKDPIKARELLNMLIDENEEIKDADLFKKEVTEEVQISKQNLLTMVSDIKEAIKEGSAKDVALYLESIIMEESGDDNESLDDDEEECADDCSCGLNEGGKCLCSKKMSDNHGCGGCKGCGNGGGCGTGCGGDAVDVFANLAEYEKNLEKSDDNIKH